MRTLRAVHLIMLCIVAATSLTGCRTCSKWNPFAKRSADPMAPMSGIESSVLPEPIRGQTPQECADLKRVYFDFDSADILPRAQQELNANAAWMKSNANVQIQIEGHCDERGTPDYNYALGQRRAEAARAYLESQGISGKRLHTISYGAERPEDPGKTDIAYARNRRVQFAVFAGQ